MIILDVELLEFNRVETARKMRLPTTAYVFRFQSAPEQLE